MRALREAGRRTAQSLQTEDFVAAVKEATGGKGVDVILDMVGGDTSTARLNASPTTARIVIIAFLGGAKGDALLDRHPAPRLTVTGSALRRARWSSSAIAKNLREKVWPLIEVGKIKAVIHKDFPLPKRRRRTR